VVEFGSLASFDENNDKTGICLLVKDFPLESGNLNSNEWLIYSLLKALSYLKVYVVLPYSSHNKYVIIT